MTKKQGTPNPVVKKALDAVGRAVLGPESGRGVEPRDARELADKQDGGR